MVNDFMEEVNEEAINIISDKTDVEKILALNNIKLGEERSKYLGVEKDDVLYSFTLDELKKPKTYKLLEKNMSDIQSEKVLIRGNLYSKIIVKIIKIARKKKLEYIVVKDPEFQGNVGLVITK